jgi:hypothetical protein
MKSENEEFGEAPSLVRKQATSKQSGNNKQSGSTKQSGKKKQQ